MGADNDISLELQNLSFAYNDKNDPVLNNCSYRFFRGGLYALMGPNGSGKTTLINLIAGITPESAGSILIGGSRASPEYRKRNVGCVQQSLSLFNNLTVEQNLILGRDVNRIVWKNKLERKKQCAEKLVSIGFKGKISCCVGKLSFSDRQKIEIVRVLTRLDSPQILVFDEPTTALSEHERKEFYELLSKLRQSNVTVIVITHFDAHLRDFNPRYITIKGKKIEQLSNLRPSPIRKDSIVKRVKNNNEVSFRSKYSSGDHKDIEIGQSVYEGQCLIIPFNDSHLRATFVDSWINHNPEWTTTLDPDGISGPAIERPGYQMKQVIRVLTMDRLKDCGFSELSLKDNWALIGQDKCILKKRKGQEEITRCEAIIEGYDIKAELSKGKMKARDIAMSPLRVLSGGNMQRFMIACLLSYPAILTVLEEPLTGISPDNWHDIFARIGEYTSGGGRALIATCFSSVYEQSQICGLEVIN